jgi:hypothetical protein
MESASGKVPKVLRRSPRRVKAEDVRLPGSTGWREFRVARSRTSRDVEVADSAFFWREKKARRIAPLQFVLVMRSRLPGSGCHFERLDVSELSQKRVLIVVATARFDPPLLVEVADLAEGQRHLAPSRRHRTQRPVVGAFDGELGDAIAGEGGPQSS